MLSKKVKRRNRIRFGIRKKISGTSECPRMAIFRSNKDIYVQLIDDEKGHTMANVSSRQKDIVATKGTKTEKSKMVGLEMAKTALKLGIKKVVFDRGGFLYHGRVKALAEGAREGGMTF